MPKTCPVCRVSLADKAALKQHISSKHPALAGHYTKPKGSGSSKASPSKSRKSKPRKTAVTASIGGVTGRLSMEEYWGTCKKGATVLWIKPGKTRLPRLDQYALMYDTYRIHKWAVKFTVRVGSTVSGMYIAGATYAYGDMCDTLEEVAATSPKVHSPVWQPSILNVPASALMRQAWYQVMGFDDEAHAADTLAGYVNVFVDGSAAEIDAWVSYDVEFKGPTRTRIGDKILAYDASTRKWKLDGKEVSKVDFDESSPGYSIDVESNDQSVKDWLSKIFLNARVVDEVVVGVLRTGPFANPSRPPAPDPWVEIAKLKKELSEAHQINLQLATEISELSSLNANLKSLNSILQQQNRDLSDQVRIKTDQLAQITKQRDRLKKFKRSVGNYCEVDIRQWTNDEKIERRLGLRLSDFGDFKSWDDKTPDSNGQVYRVNSHTMWWTNIGGVDDPIFQYPDWLWFDSEPPKPSPKGVLVWLSEGQRPDWPFGNLAYRAHVSCFQRMDAIIREADDLVTRFKGVKALFTKED